MSARENDAAFAMQDRFVRITHLDSAAFRKWRDDRQHGGVGRFAHSSVSLRLNTNVSNDPFGSLSKLELEFAPSSQKNKLGDKIDLVISGLIEAACHGLSQSSAFREFADQTLSKMLNGAHQAPDVGIEDYADNASRKVIQAISDEELLTIGENLVERFVRFMAADTVEAKAQFIRNADQLKPRLESYYSSYPIREKWPAIERHHWKVSCTRQSVRGKPFYHLTIVPREMSKMEILFEQIGDRYLIDWECWTGSGDMTLDEFIRLRPSHGRLGVCLCLLQNRTSSGGPSQDGWRTVQRV